MFSGIVETIGKVEDIRREGSNVHFTIASTLASSAYIDQSISHDGVCLTVVQIIDNTHYVVTAIEETLKVTNLGSWTVGKHVNLERSILPDTRLDGHFVQGHVDACLRLNHIQSNDGSWIFTFDLPFEFYTLVVPKGSICLNGVSLTCVIPTPNVPIVQVAIIPYTYSHTNFSTLKIGDKVNVEFDILGKYLKRYQERLGQ